MKVEIRSSGEAVVSGYVNAVERFSKPLKGKGKTFVEKVQSGAFDEAITEAKSENRAIPMLIDHRWDRKVADTSTTLELREDNIGLYAKAVVSDEATVNELASKGAKGWSFGFVAIKDEFRGEGTEERVLEKIKLNEISLLINKKPAYSSTSVEVRGEEMIENEYRYCSEAIEVEDSRSNKDYKAEYEKRKREIKLIKEM